MMSEFAVASAAFRSTFRSGRLWLIQVVANALLFGLFVLWLWIPVATAWHLAWNLIGVLLLATLTLLLQGGTMRYFSSLGRHEDSGVGAAFRNASRNLPAFAICAALLCLLWYFAGTAARYEETLPNYLRSLTPQSARNLLSLHVYENAVEAGLFVLQWILAPGLLLPFLASTAACGFSGLARRGLLTWLKCAGNLWYWATLAVCAVVGVYLTGRIMGWTPDFRSSTLQRETVSLACRGIASYLIMIWAWLSVCSVAGRLDGESVGVRSDISRNPAA